MHILYQDVKTLLSLIPSDLYSLIASQLDQLEKRMNIPISHQEVLILSAIREFFIFLTVGGRADIEFVRMKSEHEGWRQYTTGPVVMQREGKRMIIHTKECTSTQKIYSLVNRLDVHTKSVTRDIILLDIRSFYGLMKRRLAPISVIPAKVAKQRTVKYLIDITRSLGKETVSVYLVACGYNINILSSLSSKRNTKKLLAQIFQDIQTWD